VSALYGRIWRVQVGTLQTDALDVEFKIKRTLRATPGTCELTIFNLTDAHRREIHGARRPLVQVEAGYRDTGLSLLFRGDGRRSQIERDGTDFNVKVLAGDGAFAIRTARCGRAFGPDTRLDEVVRAIADAMGVGTGNVPEALRAAGLDRVGALFPRGTAVRGPAARELTALLHSARLSWSIQDGVLQVLPYGGALARTAVLLSPDTGLVGSPEIGEHGALKARAFLQPDLVPGRQVQLASAVQRGLYRITTAEYTGQSTGGGSSPWYAALELRQVT